MRVYAARTLFSVGRAGGENETNAHRNRNGPQKKTTKKNERATAETIIEI